MQIGNLKLENNVFLAPMAGVTDRAFRRITKPFGPALMYTEMVSGKALHYKNQRTEVLLTTEPEEQPVAAQIFGHEPEIMAEIAALSHLEDVKLIDINMGCPAPKIVNNGDGSALMKTPSLAGEIIRRVSESAEVPVTVKIRKGWNDNSVNAVELAKIAEQNGAAAITVHGRTREQFYSGKVDLEIIRQVKEAVKIPVIGNGDITDGKTARRMLEKTGCDGIMVGRAAQGNPWIFAQIIHYLQTGEELTLPALTERVETARRHFRLLIEYKGEHRGVLEGRKHMAWYFKGISGGSRVRERVNQAQTAAEMEKILDWILENSENE